MKSYIKINKSAYDSLADKIIDSPAGYRLSDRRLISPFIINLKNNFSRPKVLELGSGAGYNLAFLEQAGFETWAIDISKKMIMVAKKKAPKTNYINADFMAYDFGRKKFDGILAKSFIELFTKEDALAILSKIKTLINKNGFFLLASNVFSESQEGFLTEDNIKKFKKKWTPTELLEAVEKIGFNVCRNFYYNDKKDNSKWINLILK